MTPNTTKSCQCSRLSQACHTTTPRARKGTRVTSPVAIRSAVSFAQGSMSCALRALCIPVHPFSVASVAAASRPDRPYFNRSVAPEVLPAPGRLADAAARASLQLGDLERQRIDHAVEVADRGDVALAQHLRRHAGLRQPLLEAVKRLFDRRDIH